MMVGLAQVYLEQALLLAVAWAALRASWAWSRRSVAAGPSRWHAFALAAIGLALVLPVATRSLPTGRGARVEPLQGSRAVTATSFSPSVPVSASAPSGYRVYVSPNAQSLAQILLLGAGLGLAAGTLRCFGQQRRLRRHLETLPVIRRHHRVSICACDRAAVPYAAHAGGRAWIVVPSDLLEDWAELRVLMAHELAHHRRRDIQAGWCLELLQSLFFWWPVLSLWKRLLEELQELSCDAVVVARLADPRVYGEILLASLSLDQRLRFLPKGTAGASGHSTAVLRRRIEMILNEGRVSERPLADGLMAAGCIALLGVCAITAHAAVLDPTPSGAELAPVLSSLGKQGLTVPVNDRVMEELTLLGATRASTTSLEAASQRLALQREKVNAILDRYHVPTPLAAVPVVESGFRSLAARPGVVGAGAWQFIVPTARRYGLRVDGALDERMDLERETDAAARYLAAMYLQFQDWPLALAAYNQGPEKVFSSIEQGGTRDAWELMRRGLLGRYAAEVMATTIALEQPGLVGEGHYQ
jgi:membrane-bound lytic murein transglycosylase D